jgi:hypothetical protein
MAPEREFNDFKKIKKKPTLMVVMRNKSPTIRITLLCDNGNIPDIGRQIK